MSNTDRSGTVWFKNDWRLSGKTCAPILLKEHYLSCHWKSITKSMYIFLKILGFLEVAQIKRFFLKLILWGKLNEVYIQQFRIHSFDSFQQHCYKLWYKRIWNRSGIYWSKWGTNNRNEERTRNNPNSGPNISQMRCSKITWAF